MSEARSTWNVEDVIRYHEGRIGRSAAYERLKEAAGRGKGTGWTLEVEPEQYKEWWRKRCAGEGNTGKRGRRRATRSANGDRPAAPTTRQHSPRDTRLLSLYDWLRYARQCQLGVIMSAAYNLDVGQLTTLVCGAQECGIAFAMPTELHTKRVQDGQDFFCPNGHRVRFMDPENVRLKREIERKQKALEWEQQAKLRAQEEAARTEKRRRATKGVLTKVRQRVAKGGCPECSQTFPNLAQHMAEKHHHGDE